MILGLVDTTGKYLAPEYGEFFFYLVVIGIVSCFQMACWGEVTDMTDRLSIGVERSAVLGYAGGHRRVGSDPVIGAIGFVLFPDDLAFLTRLIGLALLVLSLDLVTGYCGIATLGHAAIFGVSAYVARQCLSCWSDRSYCVADRWRLERSRCGSRHGALVARFRGLPQLVLSIAVGQLTAALANKLSSLTGGSDGLSGIEPGRLFGIFAFDMYGRTGYIFSVAVLAVVFAILRRLVNSPFGLLCRAIKDDSLRARMIGARIYPRLVIMYGFSGAVAGSWWRCHGHQHGRGGLDSVSFERSAEALVMLVVGGAGSLWGALFGSLVFQFFRTLRFGCQPIRLAGDDGGTAYRHRSVRAAWAGRVGRFTGAAGCTACLEKVMTELLQLKSITKSFGGLRVSDDISFSLGEGDRVALIGPNGAGKTTLVNIISGDVTRSSGTIFLNGEDITHLSIPGRVTAGLVRTFQVTRLFSSLTVAQNVAIAVMQKRGLTKRLFSNPMNHPGCQREWGDILELLGIAHLSNRLYRTLLTVSNACLIWR